MSKARNAIADVPAGTYRCYHETYNVTVYENPKTVEGGTSYGKTIKGEVYNPDFAVATNKNR